MVRQSAKDMVSFFCSDHLWYGFQLLALLVWIIDIKGYKGWSRFFESFGVNPLLFMYSLTFWQFFCYDSNDLCRRTNFFTRIHIQCPFATGFGDKGGSLIFALLFVLLNWAIGYILYKKKIYIKI